MALLFLVFLAPLCLGSHPDSVVFLQVSSHSREASGYPKTDRWFGAFSGTESTWNADGEMLVTGENPESLVQDGIDVHSDALPMDVRSSRSRDWFHESSSAGPADAWQTHDTMQGQSVAFRDGEMNDWKYLGGAYDDQGYTQNSLPERIGDSVAGPIAASWFDQHVTGFDGFGRRSVPTRDNGARFGAAHGAEWTEIAVNTSIACATAGCNASALLQAFDPSTEVGENCRLSVAVHPTDFDAEFSLETVKFITANNKLLKTNCTPQSMGCNETAWRPLQTCVTEFPVDSFMNEDGSLEVALGITDMVDECPYNGNYLSAVSWVTCMVAPKSSLPTTFTAAAEERAAARFYPTNTSVFFNCSEPGCEANFALFFDASPVFNSTTGKCTLSVDINQTDYDEPSKESIEYVKLLGSDIRTGVSPGMNPCVTEYGGTPVTATDKVYNLVNQDITSEVRGSLTAGYINMSIKISPYVDDCGIDGQLLTGIAQVVCEYGTTSLLQASSAPSVKDVRRFRGSGAA